MITLDSAFDKLDDGLAENDKTDTTDIDNSKSKTQVLRNPSLGLVLDNQLTVHKYSLHLSEVLPTT